MGSLVIGKIQRIICMGSLEHDSVDVSVDDVLNVLCPEHLYFKLNFELLPLSFGWGAMDSLTCDCARSDMGYQVHRCGILLEDDDNTKPSSQKFASSQESS